MATREAPHPTTVHEERARLDEILHNLIKVGQWCAQRGWAEATSGNYSARLGAQRFTITASGRHKGMLSLDDFTLLDVHEGKGLRVGGPAPSAEMRLHALFYHLRADVGAILHTHSAHAAVLSMLASSSSDPYMLRFSGYEMQKALSGIKTHESTVLLPILDNHQDMEMLAQHLESHPQRTTMHGFILRGHGLYSFGTDVANARITAEALEYLIHCALLTRQAR